MTDWVNDRISEMGESLATLQTIEKKLTYTQLCWRPKLGGWSVAQIVEHLVLTDAPCVEPISKLLDDAPRGYTPWRPTLMGRLITRAVLPQTKWKTEAGKGFRPTTQPQQEVLQRYAAICKQLTDLLERSRDVNANRVRTNYPIRTPFNYNLGDAFMILTRHTQRHRLQIERIRSLPEFPSPS